MESNIYTLMIQAMQVPVVSLVIIYSFSNRLKRVNEVAYPKGDLRRQLLGTPLKYITIGLIFNLLYLVFNILGSPFLNLPFFHGQWQNRTIIFFDLFTAYFFLLEAVGWVFPDHKPAVSGKLRLSEARNTAMPARITGFFFLLLTLFIWIKNFDKTTIFFFIFDFTGYFIVGLCLFYKFSLKETKNAYANKFLFAGFMAWSLLQLWMPFGDFIGLAPIHVAEAGFGLSLIVKGLILFGLYNYSASIASSAFSVSEQQNTELNRKIHHLGELQDLINIVSDAGSLQQLSERVVSQFTSSGLFPYGYAALAVLNEQQNTVLHISGAFSKDFEPGLFDGAVRKQEDTTVEGAWQLAVTSRGIVYIDNRVISFERPPAKRNLDVEAISNELHDRYLGLHSLIIPILKVENRRSESVNNKKLFSDQVTAVLEIVVPSVTGKSSHIIEYSGELRIYLDNCSQAIEKLKLMELEDQVRNLLQTCGLESKDNHREYLRQVLQSLVILLKAEGGTICMVNDDALDKYASWIHSPSLTPSRKASLDKTTERMKKEGKFNIGTAVFPETYCSLITAALEKEVSYVSEKIIFSDYSYCYFLICAVKKPFFSSGQFKFIMARVSAELCLAYNEKKFHYCVAESIMPSNKIMEPSSTFMPAINLLQAYFTTTHIAIWLNDQVPGAASFFTETYVTTEYSATVRQSSYLQRVPSGQADLPNEPAVYDLSKKYDRNNLRLNTVIPVPGKHYLVQKSLKTDFQNYGFINLYFTAVVEKISGEDSNFLNLLATKLVLNLQVHNLVSAFQMISNSFIQNDFNVTLKKITDQALSLLNANPVILFKSRDGEHVFFKDVTYSTSSDFIDKGIIEVFKKKGEQHVELAELIIADNNCYFNNNLEYQGYVAQTTKKYEQENFRSSFWERENIKSMAAIRLMNKIGNKNKPVGVMFINFRNPVKFSEEIKRLIETFAAFASGSIANGLIFERNYQYLNRNLKMSQPLLVELIAHGALHDAHKTFKAINSSFFRMIDEWDSVRYKRKNFTVFDLRGDIKKLEIPFNDLYEQFEKLSTLYKPSDVLEINEYDIVKIINEQLEQIETDLNSKFIKVIFDPEPARQDIECDAATIGNAIFNILYNACQAMDARGSLEIRLSSSGDNIQIEIIDDGKGISKDIYSMVMEPYITDKPDGSGLGLSMSKVSVEKHGGTLKYHSKPKRTSFIITLPKRIKHV